MASMLTVKDLVEECNISHDQLEQRCSEEHLKATVSLVTSFTTFASELGIPKSTLSAIENNEKLRLEQKTEKVFLFWQENMSPATYQSFVEVCLKLGEANVARKLMCELCAATEESQAKTRESSDPVPIPSISQSNEQQFSASRRTSPYMGDASSVTNSPPPKAQFEMSWMKSDISAPENFLRPIDAVAYGDTAYFRNYFTSIVYSFHKVTRKWVRLPECLVEDTSLVVLPVINGEYCLHTVGGRNPINERECDRDEFSSVLYHYRRVRKGTPATWQCSDYPDMTIKRSQVTVAYSDGYVIAAGGCSDHGVISKVEVMNIKSPKPEWSRVISLPKSVFRASQCVCNGFLYILGGNVRDKSNGCLVPTRIASVISIDKLVKSLGQDKDEFMPIEDLCLKESAFVVCRNNVVAIGGWQFDKEQSMGTKLVHVYDKNNDTWIRLDSAELKEPRCQNFAVAFNDETIMTVGGYENPCGVRTNSVEFAKL